jgi:hypothetical protein
MPVLPASLVSSQLLPRLPSTLLQLGYAILGDKSVINFEVLFQTEKGVHTKHDRKGRRILAEFFNAGEDGIEAA